MQGKGTVGKINFEKPLAPMERISATMEGMIKRKEKGFLSHDEKFEE